MFSQLLIGEEAYLDSHRQAAIPCTVLKLVHGITMFAWKKTDVDIEFKGSFYKFKGSFYRPLQSLIQTSWANL